MSLKESIDRLTFKKIEYSRIRIEKTLLPWLGKLGENLEGSMKSFDMQLTNLHPSFDMQLANLHPSFDMQLTNLHPSFDMQLTNLHPSFDMQLTNLHPGFDIVRERVIKATKAVFMTTFSLKFLKKLMRTYL